MAGEHRYVSFTDRVASIRIDPVRKTDSKQRVIESTTDSYFKQTAEHWNELNLASKYTDFVHKCTPLAQSLPMIIYNSDKIFDLLENACMETDEHSAESLLDLLVNFARDLGSDFEPYYERSLKVCLHLISLYQKDDSKLIIVECAFNSLAYIFKYLARLLTANLTPTYTILLPLFGKSKQRAFVLRFAAESMGFLLRKCKEQNLTAIISYIVTCCLDATAQTKQQMYSSASMLLADTLKGPGNMLHSKAQLLLNVYLQVCVELNCVELAAMVLVDVLHHVRKETAKPVYETALNYCDKAPLLIFVLAGLRKGDRVPNFEPLFKSFLDVAEPKTSEQIQAWALAGAALVSYADLGSVYKYFGKVVQSTSSTPALTLFIEIVNTEDPKRLTTFISKIPDLGDQFNVLVQLDTGIELTQKGARPVVKQIDVNSNTENELGHSLFNVWLALESHAEFDCELLLSKLLDLPETNSLLMSVVCADLFVKAGKPEKFVDLMISKLVFTPQLLTALPDRAKELIGNEKLIKALYSCDIKLRSAALRAIISEDENDLLNQCLVTNELPLDLEHARDISHRMRQLALRCSSSKKLRKLIVAFFFGMLTTRLQPVWTAVVEQMAVLGESSPTEVCEMGKRFITEEETGEYKPGSIDLAVSSTELSSFRGEPWDFDCSTLQRLEEVSRDLNEDVVEPRQALMSRCSSIVTLQHFDDLFFLGIKALISASKPVEKHLTKMLVPLLLNCDENDYKRAEILLLLFSKFTKPHKFEQYDEIKNCYMFYLASRHSPLQRLALRCLLKVPEYKVVQKYRENLTALLDDSQYRDQLTLLTTSGETALHPDDEESILPFLTRILYGRAIGGGKRNFRNASINALHSLPSCLPLFINLANEHLHRVTSNSSTTDETNEETLQEDTMVVDKTEDDNNNETENENETETEETEKSHTRRFVGYLSLINDTVRVLQSSVKDVIPVICFDGVFYTLKHSSSSNEDRVVRQLATKILIEMISSVPSKELWATMFDKIYELLVPDLSNFGQLNKETPATILRLFIAVSAEPDLVDFVPDDFVEAAISCLKFNTVKEPVIQAVLQLVLNLAANNPTKQVPGASQLLISLSEQLDRQLDPDTLALAVQCVSKLYTALDSSSVKDLSTVSLKLLQQPSKLVPLHVKAVVLEALSKLLDNEACPIDVHDTAYFQLAHYFRVFVAREAREMLVACYKSMGEKSIDRQRAAALLAELNSYDDTRLGEPDFARRSAAFEKITDGKHEESKISEKEWFPLLLCMFFFMKDPEEASLRNQAKYAVCKFIELFPASPTIETVVLPAMLKGLREPDDKFRNLYIDILGQLTHSHVLKLEPLLFKGDEEADFFINIVHTQIHRRRRAVQRLGNMVPELDPNALQYLIALIENLCLLSGSKSGEMNNLADDALVCLTKLVQQLTPGQYKAITRRWVRTIRASQDKKETRRGVRIMSSISEASANLDGTPKLQINDVLNIVQSLHEILTKRANEYGDLPDRIPLAIAIVNFLITLPSEELEIALPGKLTSLCQLLRAKQPEMRDAARQTLGKVVKILPVRYLRFVIAEMRSSLQRGGLQRHILGYTVHYLLAILQQSEALKPGDLDDSAEMIFKSVMDDIFGIAGEEKDDENYLTDAKEVKQHKSFNTAEILASNISLSRFDLITQPIRYYLLSKKLSARIEHKGDQLMVHIASGLHRSVEFKTQEAVVLGYSIFMQSMKEMAPPTENNEQNAGAESEKSEISGALAAREAAKKETEEFFTLKLKTVIPKVKEAGNLHMLQAFSLSLLRNVLTSTVGGSAGAGKGLLTPENVKGLAPIVVQGLNSTFEDVQIAAMRLATTILRVPVDLGPVLVEIGDCAYEFVESSSNTSTDLCQNAIKLITVLLRIPEFEMPAAHISFLLERLQADLDEPDRQNAAMSFARTVFGNKIMIPQVYSFADRLSEVLVQNHSDHIRANCRQAYLQFLSSYPLGQARLDKHLASLASNIRYATSDGRLSAMEMIHLLVKKVRVDQLQSAFVPFFANLVLVLVSDTEPECRLKASGLLKELIAASTAKILIEMASYCSTWLSMYKDSSKIMVVRGGLEVAPLLLPELPKKEQNQLKTVFDTVARSVLKSSSRESHELTGTKPDWQVVYLALGAEINDVPLLANVLLFPHPWVRARATRSMEEALKNVDLTKEEYFHICKRLLRQLSAPKLSAVDAKESVNVLLFLIPKIEPENVTYLITKLCSLLRTEISSAELVGNKFGVIHAVVSLPEILGTEKITAQCLEIIRSLVVLVDQLEAEESETELHDAAAEGLVLYEKVLGTPEYLKVYSQARRQVLKIRMDRRNKRSIEAVTNPELAARKRMKKNKRGNRPAH